MRQRARLLLFVSAIALGACGGEDDRPVTVEYVTEALFRPSCGTASCHSSSARTAELALDTRETVCDALNNYGTILFGVLDGSDPRYPRMPADGPLPDADIELITAWVNSPTSATECPAP